jgi:hypothetical protein
MIGVSAITCSPTMKNDSSSFVAPVRKGHFVLNLISITKVKSNAYTDSDKILEA